MQIAVIDDSKVDREVLSKMIQRYFEEKKCVVKIVEFSCGEQFLENQDRKAYDLIFLDIMMNGKNGMELAHELRDCGYQGKLVFTTTSKEYAVEGYQVQAFNYLVKPIHYEQIADTLASCETLFLQEKDYIEVKEGRLLVKILLKDIQYTDYYNHYIQIHTKHHVYRTYLSFADFFTLLEPYPQFISCYRNMVVNMDYVETIDQQDFVLKGGCRIPIAKAKRQEARQCYADYLFEKMKN